MMRCDDASPVTQVVTRDIGQMAALILGGHRPASLTQRDGIVVAVFDATPALQSAIRQYVLDESRVAPRAFLGLLRDLKGMGSVKTR